MYNHGRGYLSAGDFGLAAYTEFVGNSVYPIWNSATWSYSTYASAQDSSFNQLANVSGTNSVAAGWSGVSGYFESSSHSGSATVGGFTNSWSVGISAVRQPGGWQYS
jgi:hypothetical protein